MFKLLGLVLKLGFFAVFVLVVASWVHVDGKTLSDHIRTSLSQAESSAPIEEARGWARKLTADVTVGQKGTELISRIKDSPSEITVSEREKLRALIRDLNRSQAKGPQPSSASRSN